MTRARKKVIRLVVEISAPRWLTKAEAKREVRALINDQSFYGTRERNPDGWRIGDEIDESNFRAKRVS